jgi:hypothetical protein
LGPELDAGFLFLGLETKNQDQGTRKKNLPEKGRLEVKK